MPDLPSNMQKLLKTGCLWKIVRKNLSAEIARDLTPHLTIAGLQKTKQ